VCPRCGYAAILIDDDTGRTTDDWERFSRAIDDWHDGGPGIVACPNEGCAVAFNEWLWSSDGRMVVGRLGFEFWNWPRLHPEFVSQVGRALGHRVVVTGGKR
jgi:hypothetical protein